MALAMMGGTTQDFIIELIAMADFWAERWCVSAAGAQARSGDSSRLFFRTIATDLFHAETEIGEDFFDGNRAVLFD